MSNIRPLAVRELLGDGAYSADGSPSSATGRLNCIPWPLAQAPSHESWRIDSILVNNWGVDDAIYSITVEASDYTQAGHDRAAVSPVVPGLRARSAFATTGAATIRWGRLISGGDDHRILGPFWVMPGEWLAGAAIPGFTTGLVNCTFNGWAFS